MFSSNNSTVKAAVGVKPGKVNNTSSEINDDESVNTKEEAPNTYLEDTLKNPKSSDTTAETSATKSAEIEAKIAAGKATLRVETKGPANKIQPLKVNLQPSAVKDEDAVATNEKVFNKQPPLKDLSKVHEIICASSSLTNPAEKSSIKTLVESNESLNDTDDYGSVYSDEGFDYVGNRRFTCTPPKPQPGLLSRFASCVLPCCCKKAANKQAKFEFKPEKSENQKKVQPLDVARINYEGYLRRFVNCVFPCCCREKSSKLGTKSEMHNKKCSGRYRRRKKNAQL